MKSFLYALAFFWNTVTFALVILSSFSVSGAVLSIYPCKFYYDQWHIMSQIWLVITFFCGRNHGILLCVTGSLLMGLRTRLQVAYQGCEASICSTPGPSIAVKIRDHKNLPYPLIYTRFSYLTLDLFLIMVNGISTKHMGLYYLALILVITNESMILDHVSIQFKKGYG